MNNEIAGKIMSEVKGFELVMAAVAKELNATSRGMPVQRAILHDFDRKTISVERCKAHYTYRSNANLP